MAVLGQATLLSASVGGTLPVRFPRADSATNQTTAS